VVADQRKPGASQHEDPSVSVTAQPGSRLEQLLAVYDDEKAAAAEAAERFKAVTDALKAEMAAAVPPGTEDMTLIGAAHLPRLRLSWRRPWRFDSDKFREENPYLFVKYSKQGGHWELRAMQ
jgi:hypothetical protein